MASPTLLTHIPGAVLPRRRARPLRSSAPAASRRHPETARPSQTARHRLTHVSAAPGGSRTTEAARAARDMREDSGMRGCHMPGASHGRGRRASARPSQSGCPGAGGWLLNDRQSQNLLDHPRIHARIASHAC
jgi:hypothetical protein